MTITLAKKRALEKAKAKRKWNERMEKVFEDFKNRIQLRYFIYRRRQW